MHMHIPSKSAKPEYHQKASMLGELCERMKEVVELYRTVVHYVYAWLCHAHSLHIYSQHIRVKIEVSTI